MVMSLFRMSDLPGADRRAIQISKLEASTWNTPEHGFGIFMTVNDFGGQPRRKENLKRILAWPIDIDDGSKAEQFKRLHSSPLVPSLIVETKRGYQAYWIARDGQADHWNAIVLERLVPYFGADKNARDLCRILRVPGFWHLKDPTQPFMVREVWRQNVAYTESQMAAAFRWVPDRKTHETAADERRRAEARKTRERARAEAAASGLSTETFWEAVYDLDCEDGLRRLSGHWSVGGESYSFQRTSRGNLNLVVDKKLTSCFIDESKRIGSMSGGGPTLASWLRWFKHPWPTVIAVLKEIYPHLVDVDEASKRRAA